MIESNIWDRIVASGLYSNANAKSLQSLFLANRRPSDAPDEAAVLKWLTDQKRLTPFQNQVLEQGFAGPFRFGEYLIERPLSKGCPEFTFQAFHIPTKFQVSLRFIAGTKTADLAIWDEVCRRARLLQGISDPTAIRVFDAIQLPEYRFIVMDRIQGPPLVERLGRKGRVEWPAAVNIAAAITPIIAELHSLDSMHGQINSSTVILESSGIPRLLLPVTGDWNQFDDEYSDQIIEPAGEGYREPASDYLPPRRQFPTTFPRTQSADVYALGILLFRMICGETPAAIAGKNEERSREAVSNRIEKYDLPSPLGEFLRELANPGASITQWTTQTLVELYSSLVPESKVKSSRFKSRPHEEDFVEYLRRWTPGQATPAIDDRELQSLQMAIAESSPVRSGPVRSGNDFQPDTSGVGSFQTAPIGSGGRLPLKSKSTRQRRSLPGVVWGTTSILLIAVLASIIYFFRQNQLRVAVESSDANPPPVTQPDPELANPPRSDNDAPPYPPKATGNWVQKLIADDGVSLWESPTMGPPIDYSHLPSGAAIVVHLKPKEWSTDAQSVLLWRALGPAVDQSLAAIEQQIPVPTNELSELIIGLYPGDSSRYDACFICRPSPEIGRADVEQELATRDIVATDPSSQLFSQGARYFAILGGPTDKTTTSAEDHPAEPLTLIIGSRSLVERAAASKSANALAGPLERLVAKTDRDRMFTLLALKSALFTEEGRQLMVAPFAQLNRPISLWLPDEIQGVGASFHIDSGLYGELFFEQTADITPNQLQTNLTDKLKTLREQLIGQVSAIQPTKYWELVHQRFDNMLIDFFRHIRSGVEYNQVVVNFWLPEIAGHNLLAGTELLLASDSSAASDAATDSRPPDSIEALLETKRDLVDQNPPDLNIIMETLQQDIRDQFPGLPFKFEIQLSNDDLKEAGITRNQRPTALNLQNQSIAAILTRIVFLANPDKNAVGPDDARCKLVWVVTRDEATNTSRVLITTRAGVQKKGYTLPAPFIPRAPE